MSSRFAGLHVDHMPFWSHLPSAQASQWLRLHISFFFFLVIFIFLFLAALGLRCCARALSSCGELGATLRCSAWASHCGGFSCCGARALGAWASVVVARGLSSCGLQAPERRLSSCGARLSCSAACGILPDQGSNPCPLNWQADS